MRCSLLIAVIACLLPGCRTEGEPEARFLPNPADVRSVEVVVSYYYVPQEDGAEAEETHAFGSNDAAAIAMLIGALQNPRLQEPHSCDPEMSTRVRFHLKSGETSGVTFYVGHYEHEIEFYATSGGPYYVNRQRVFDALRAIGLARPEMIVERLPE